MESTEAMTQLGDDLIAALGQALAHARGENSGVGRVHEIDTARKDVDVKAVRQRVGLKQREMARIMDMSLSGYRKWEQRKRSLSGPARTMLVVMEREPQAVMRALGQDLAAASSVVPKEVAKTGRTGQKPAKRRLRRRAPIG